MTLSIIIVNYNVKYFLEQCLCSVTKAINKRETEIFVVDNNSTDGSLEYLQPKFPQVKFISNTKNVGFAKANNQALLKASGKFILFLNPDTIVAEDSFEKCISFLALNKNAGAVGVRMIDGSGFYLKESKRGFPSPWVSFCKLSGLIYLFPQSKIFAKYYLGHLKENENNPVDVLSGAYMMVKKEVLDNIGGFDEQFFMYAEDIDLSYRIQKANYFNYYLAETTIIHFKGESTQKGFRYVKLFYKAMSQFVRKHYDGDISFFFAGLMDFAIWLRAAISLISNIFKSKKIKSNNKEIKSLLRGDIDDENYLKDTLVSLRRIIVQDEKEADEIIFCEGNNFSFKKIINEFEKRKTHVQYKIYADKSGSITGSSSKNGMGKTIHLFQ
jgi:N-acetylglucosaminyl-diphospho-decaprenol L-rhamnosyltransferase